jgi:hypothetical protein
VDTGSREENASKQKLETGSDSVRTGEALGCSKNNGSVQKDRAVAVAELARL